MSEEGESSPVKEPSNRERARIKSSVSSGPSSSSSSSSDLSLPTPPDGGWGWCVVFASFVVHMIADGCAFSFGVLYTELLDYFGESKGKTAWIPSLFLAVPLITGPVASAMTNKYGCRITTMIGGTIAAIGFVMSSFANSVEMLCVTIGVISGFGLSMAYVPGVVVVAFYFENKRAFATGVAVAGSGIGTFIFAPLTEYLINLYTWRGAVLVIGGIMLNIVVCGCIYRPLIDPKLAKEQKKRKKALEQFAKMSPKKNSEEFYCLTKANGTTPSPEYSDLGLQRMLDEPVTHSLLHFPTYLQKEITDACPNVRSSKKTLHQVLQENDLLDRFYESQNDITHSSLTNIQSFGNGFSSIQNNAKSNLGSSNNESARKVGSLKKSSKTLKKIRLASHLPMGRKDVFYRGNIGRANFSKAASCPNINMYHPEDDDDASSCSSDEDEGRLSIVKCFKFSKEVKHTVQKMLDLSILRSIVFVYFCFSTFLLYLAYDVPYVFTPDKAISMGINHKESSFLVSIIGITSTVGQIVIGYLGDLPQVKTVLLYAVLTSIAGVVTVLVPWYINYGMLAAYCAAYGVFISANYTLTTIVLVNLLGMDKLTNAYGLEMLAEGVANLIGPPIGGWICDVTGSYDLAFICAGIVIFISGAMLFFIPCIRPFDHVIRDSSPETSESDSDEEEDTFMTKLNGNGVHHNGSGTKHGLTNGTDLPAIEVNFKDDKAISVVT